MSARAWPLPLSPVRTGAPARSVSRAGLLCTAIVAVLWAVGSWDFEMAVTALSGLGLLLLVLSLRYPDLGLIGIGVFCTMDALSRYFLLAGGLLRYNSFNYILVLVMLLSWKRFLRWRDLPVRLLAALLVLLGVELLYSAGPAFGIQHIANAVGFFGLLVFMERASRSDQPWISMALVSATTAGLGGLVFFLQGEELQDRINPNAWAYFPLAALLAICLAIGRRGASRNVRLVLLVLAAVNAGWVFLSGSRGTSLVAIVAVLYSLSRSRRFLTAAALTLVMLGLGVLAVGFFGDRAERSLQRVGKFFDPAYSLSSKTSGRWDLARAGMHLFVEHPLTGIGTGSFASEWMRLSDLGGMSQYGLGREVQAHSGWIKVAAENGAPGLLLLIAFVGSFTLIGWRYRARGALPIGLLASLTLSVGFLSTEFQPKALWFLTAAATLILRRTAARRRPAAPVRPAHAGRVVARPQASHV